MQRSLLAFLLLLLSALASAQGGSMGGVQGGEAGGWQGSDIGDGDTTRKQLFLSPGDKTEWSFEAGDNDTVFVRITSSVFDPAVSILDEAGAKLAENDDIEAGDQMAQLVFTVPKPGKYKVVVTNYKGTAGGAFEFSATRFKAVPLQMNQERQAAADNRRSWARVSIQQAGDYVITLPNNSRFGVPTVLRPNGQRQGINVLDQDDDYLRARFFTEEKGTFYIGNFSSGNPFVKVAPVAIREIAIGATEQASLKDDEIYDWRIACKAGDLLKITVIGDPDQFTLTPLTTQVSGGRRLYTTLVGGSDPTSTVAVINDFRLAYMVKGVERAAKPYGLKVERVGNPWGGPSLDSKLGWFQQEVWYFDAKVGDVVRLQSASPVFQTRMTVMLPDGRTVGSQQVKRTPDQTILLAAPTSGRYVVLIGGTGVGSYKLTREVFPPRSLTEGTVAGKLGTGDPEVWRYSARAGQDMVLRVTRTDAPCTITVTGPSGQQIASLGESDDFVRLKIQEAGDYTVTVYPVGKATGSYTMKWIDLDKK